MRLKFSLFFSSQLQTKSRYSLIDKRSSQFSNLFLGAEWAKQVTAWILLGVAKEVPI